jgi:uncharacterized RDD family membrane protein YckC
LNSSIDTLVTAETPEGIAIAMYPAGFAVRATAFLIDGVLRIAINWLYAPLFELMWAAATPGKRVMGLHVLMANGLPLTPAGCLVRNLLRAVDFLPFMYAFGIVSMLLRRDGRRLGDLAGGTLVAYRRPLQPAGTFGEGEPVAPSVPLNARQQAAIAAFAWRVRQLTPDRAEEIAVLAAASAPATRTKSMTLHLVGIARWLHGQRRNFSGEAGRRAGDTP